MNHRSWRNKEVKHFRAIHSLELRKDAGVIRIRIGTMNEQQKSFAFVFAAEAFSVSIGSRNIPTRPYRCLPSTDYATKITSLHIVQEKRAEQ